MKTALDLALDELNVPLAGRGRIGPGERQHFVGHVQAVGESGGPDPPGGR